jgi:hypothetical protein
LVVAKIKKSSFHKKSTIDSKEYDGAFLMKPDLKKQLGNNVQGLAIPCRCIPLSILV